MMTRSYLPFLHQQGKNSSKSKYSQLLFKTETEINLRSSQQLLSPCSEHLVTLWSRIHRYMYSCNMTQRCITINAVFKTAQEQTSSVTQQHGDCCTGHWWVDCCIWYNKWQDEAWVGWGPALSPPHCTKYNSPPINGQCTSFILFDMAL